MRLLLATRNAHKAVELKLLLSTIPIEIMDLSAFPDTPPIHEISESLKGNASLKALNASLHTGTCALGDDTGLFVHALGGRPGVHSARFAGENASAERNCARVLELLSGKSDRTARFSTVLALAHPTGLQYFEGHLDGYIADSPLSTQGFGYEPIFVPDGFKVSLAQLTRDEKNRISHRAQSAAKLIRFIRGLQ